MAPEFLPFIAAGFLLLASLVAMAVLAIVFVVRKRLPRPLTLLAFLSTCGLLLVTGFCVSGVRQQYFLDEPMASAAASGRLAEVRQLLDKGASPDAWGVDYVSPALVGAAEGGHVVVVKLLLERGADPDRRDSGGKTAAERAREGGHIGVVDLILSKRSSTPASR